MATGLCLDNHSYLFTYEEALYADPCHGKLNTQVSRACLTPCIAAQIIFLHISNVVFRQGDVADD